MKIIVITYPPKYTSIKSLNHNLICVTKQCSLVKLQSNRERNDTIWYMYVFIDVHNVNSKEKPHLWYTVCNLCICYLPVHEQSQKWNYMHSWNWRTLMVSLLKLTDSTTLLITLRFITILALRSVVSLDTLRSCLTEVRTSWWYTVAWVYVWVTVRTCQTSGAHNSLSTWWHGDYNKSRWHMSTMQEWKKNWGLWPGRHSSRLSINTLLTTHTFVFSQIISVNRCVSKVDGYHWESSQTMRVFIDYYY